MLGVTLAVCVNERLCVIVTEGVRAWLRDCVCDFVELGVTLGVLEFDGD